MAYVLAASPPEQSKAVGHHFDELLDGVCVHLHGGEFDGERDAFQQSAQLPDERHLFVVGLEVGAVLFREDEEKLDRIVPPRSVRRGAGFGSGTLSGGNVTSQFGNEGLFENVEVTNNLLNDRDKRLLATKRGPVNTESFISFVRRAVKGKWVEGGKMRHVKQ